MFRIWLSLISAGLAFFVGLDLNYDHDDDDDILVGPAGWGGKYIAGNTCSGRRREEYLGPRGRGGMYVDLDKGYKSLRYWGWGLGCEGIDKWSSHL